MVGERYDARFLEDRLAVFPAYGWESKAEVPYSQIEDMEIGGPGLVKSGGGFTGGGFGTVAALEGMAIAAILNALTTRTTITTIVRVQGTDCELFFLHTRSAPEQLRMQMSPALGAIRSARAAAAQSGKAVLQSPSPGSPVGDLAKLAEMLSAGLLTREEFEQLKAQLLRG
jgi:hypothetical protein